MDKVLRRIVGFLKSNKIPCEATFSNAFREFSRENICQKIHENLVKQEFERDIIFHVSRDSTAIEAREKPVKKEKLSSDKIIKTAKQNEGIKASKKLPTKIEKQGTQNLSQMLKDLEGTADYGGKIDSKGNFHPWIGYKLHVDYADNGVPLSVIVTSASIHDSSVSIPLHELTTSRVKCLYILADKAYDSKQLRENIISHGQVPIIPEKKRNNGSEKKFETFEREKFKIRATAEEGNSQLKDSFGARNIFYRGYEKVSCHLMLGILVLFAETVARL